MLQGKYKEAILLCKSNYDFMIKHYGEENLSIAYVLTDLGICYSYIGQYEEAEKNLNRALEIKLKNLGRVHIKRASNIIATLITDMNITSSLSYLVNTFPLLFSLRK